MSGLLYFTHGVDDHVYGAWYRILSTTEIEVIGVGMLELADYAGFSPESAARSVLENFVRQRIVDGVPIPSLDALPPPEEEEDSLHFAALSAAPPSHDSR